MKANERAQSILEHITQSSIPVSGNTLSQKFGVSRQIIVKDIAALKDSGNDIIATARGYILNRKPLCERVFKVVHTDEETEKELRAIVGAGAIVKDVFVWHKIYGKLEAELNMHTQEDVSEYMTSLNSGRSLPLKNVTNGYHYHTIAADTENELKKVGTILSDLGFLVEDE